MCVLFDMCWCVLRVECVAFCLLYVGVRVVSVVCVMCCSVLVRELGAECVLGMCGLLYVVC